MAMFKRGAKSPDGPEWRYGATGESPKRVNEAEAWQRLWNAVPQPGNQAWFRVTRTGTGDREIQEIADPTTLTAEQVQKIQTEEREKSKVQEERAFETGAQYGETKKAEEIADAAQSHTTEVDTSGLGSAIAGAIGGGE